MCANDPLEHIARPVPSNRAALVELARANQCSVTNSASPDLKRLSEFGCDGCEGRNCGCGSD